MIAGSGMALNSWEVASKSLMMTASAAIESTARHSGLLDSWMEVGLPEESSDSAGEEIVFVLLNWNPARDPMSRMRLRFR